MFLIPYKWCNMNFFSVTSLLVILSVFLYKLLLILLLCYIFHVLLLLLCYTYLWNIILLKHSYNFRTLIKTSFWFIMMQCELLYYIIIQSQMSASIRIYVYKWYYIVTAKNYINTEKIHFCDIKFYNSYLKLSHCRITQINKS